MLKKISKVEFDALTTDGEILIMDCGYPKVILLPGERVAKLFRRKRLISSQIWKTHAARFAENAERLIELGVETVTIESTFLIPEIERNGVFYKLLKGETLRDWLQGKSAEERQGKIGQFGKFLSRLHNKGVLFRSIHLANVVVTEKDTFGLIDISDMSFKSKHGLSISERIRNFHHMDRYDLDRQALAIADCKPFMKNYLELSNLPSVDTKELEKAFEYIFLSGRN